MSTFLPALVSTLLIASAAGASVSMHLTHSGYVLDAGDQPITDTVNMQFTIHPTDAGSTIAAVWSSGAACPVAVNHGFYAVVLGAECGTALTTDQLPFGQLRYLEVAIDGVLLSPRLRIGVVPAAVLAAESLDTIALKAALSSSGSLNAIANPVDWTQLKNVPAFFSDGSDDDTIFTAAADGGLSLLGTAFSITAGGVTNAMLQNQGITLAAGTGLTGGGALALGGSTTFGLANTAVTANTYTHPTLTVDAQGRITAASSNSVTSGTVTSVAAGAGLTGGTITSTGILAIANDGVTNTQLASDAASLARVSGGAMAALSGGRVGIGTTSPAVGSRLEVSGGDIRVSGGGKFVGDGSLLTSLPAVNVTIGATSARPGSPAAGAGFYDTTARTLQIHDGTAWQTVGGNSVIDCKLHRTAGLTTSGNYTVVTNGNAISTWCNMTLDGGGWTEVYHQGGDENSFAIGYKPNTQPIVAGSTEMLFAFADDATNTLSQAWKFATPAAFQNATPMVAAPGPAPSGCGYVSIAATRLADSTVTTQILRYGSASFGNFCDQTCSGSWGQICLKSNSALGGGTVATDGFSDFPHFTGYVPSIGSFANVTDNCSRSDQGYSTTACAASRHFVIYVR